MKGRKVDAAIMPLKYILHCGEVVERVECARGAIRCVLAEAGYVPHADGLILGCGDNQVLLRVELGGHDVVRVSSEDSNAVPRCAVPDANRLVV